MSKKKVLKAGIVAAFVITAMTGCEDPDALVYSGMGGEQVQTYTVSSVEQCENLGAGSLSQCQEAFKSAQDEHLKAVPKYGDQSSCESGSDVACTHTQVKNSDGSFSDVFVPAMAGMIVGNMLSNGFNRNQTMPVYRDRDNRYTTSGGAYVAAGKGSIGKNTFASSSRTGGFVKPMSMTAPKPSMKSGGFGSTGRGGGATG